MKFTDINSRKKHSPVLFNHNYIGYNFNEDEYRIRVEAVDMEKGEVRNIHCKYLIGCEGVGSKIRESIGGEFVGDHSIANFINIHFKSQQLADEIKKRDLHAMLYFIYNTKVTTILVNHSMDIGEFVMQLPYFPPIQDVKDLSTEDQLTLIKNCINSDRYSDNPLMGGSEYEEKVDKIDEICGVGTWKMSAMVSDTFADYQKKIFIAGDSGHSIPPAGGYGMNSGLADAHNLAHKIANAEYNNNPGILKYYEKERKFINNLTARFAQKNFKKGEKIVSKLNVDLQTFNSLTNTLYDITPSFIPQTLTKSIFGLTIKTAQRVSLNPYSVRQKRDYLKNYDNGIALFFPNLDFSYSYPMDEKHAEEVEHFLEENYDIREYKLVNGIGSLLPLFTFWCPHTNQTYASREYVYLHQKEEKRPFYFLFKFGGENENVEDIDWVAGDPKVYSKVLEQSHKGKVNPFKHPGATQTPNVYLHVANICHVSDPDEQKTHKTGFGKKNNWGFGSSPADHSE